MRKGAHVAWPLSFSCSRPCCKAACHSLSVSCHHAIIGQDTEAWANSDFAKIHLFSFTATIQSKLLKKYDYHYGLKETFQYNRFIKKPLELEGLFCYRWGERAETRPLRLDNSLVFHSVSATNCLQN